MKPLTQNVFVNNQGKLITSGTGEPSALFGDRSKRQIVLLKLVSLTS